jgi:hypothetical protein
MAYLDNRGRVDDNNSTAVALGIGATFTGVATDVSAYSAIGFSCKTDQSGTLQAQYSTDGTNWDSTLTYNVTANLNEVHTLENTKQYFRIVFNNTSGSAQTFLRLQTILGSQGSLRSPLNLPSGLDADATLVKSIDTQFLIGEDLIAGYSVVNKFGRNDDVDTGSVPEAIWSGGGPYTGFPVGAAEEFQVFSSSASDTGVLYFDYLASYTSTEYQTGSVTLNGVTVVNTGITGVRMNNARYECGTATTFNVGTITLRHRTTTANVFCVMPIGKSITNVCAYTIPYGSIGHIERLFASVIGSNNGQIVATLWTRTDLLNPQNIRTFAFATGSSYEERPYAGLSLPAMTDIKISALTASANNLDVIAGFDIVIVGNH